VAPLSPLQMLYLSRPFAAWPLSQTLPCRPSSGSRGAVGAVNTQQDALGQLLPSLLSVGLATTAAWVMMRYMDLATFPLRLMLRVAGVDMGGYGLEGEARWVPSPGAGAGAGVA
jgi:hypothetical protein